MPGILKPFLPALGDLHSRWESFEQEDGEAVAVVVVAGMRITLFGCGETAETAISESTEMSEILGREKVTTIEVGSISKTFLRPPPSAAAAGLGGVAAGCFEPRTHKIVIEEIFKT